MRPLLLLRPEPGLSTSAARARSMGLTVIAHPLFAIQPVAVALPEGPFDGIVLTSANAVRFGGAVLDAYRDLPVHAVGEATAEAARAAGLSVVSTGTGGVDGLDLPDGRWLHPCGEDHREVPGALSVPVYRAAPTEAPLPPLARTIIAVHSPAAARRLDELAGADRGEATIIAISPAAAGACGAGWAMVVPSPQPDDEALLALAARLCQSGPA